MSGPPHQSAAFPQLPPAVCLPWRMQLLEAPLGKMKQGCPSAARGSSLFTGLLPFLRLESQTGRVLADAALDRVARTVREFGRNFDRHADCRVRVRGQQAYDLVG